MFVCTIHAHHRVFFALFNYGVMSVQALYQLSELVGQITRVNELIREGVDNKKPI